MNTQSDTAAAETTSSAAAETTSSATDPNTESAANPSTPKAPLPALVSPVAPATDRPPTELLPGVTAPVEVKMLAIADLVLDAEVHVRAETSSARVEQYTVAYMKGDVFPPIDVFYDGCDYFVANGFHRVPSRKAAGFTDILANVRRGSRRDAFLFGLTQDRGLGHSHADKRKKVTKILGDAELRSWSDAVIARMCDVSPPFVGKMRGELGIADDGVRRGADGKVKNTKNIGAKPKPKSAKAKASAENGEPPTPPADAPTDEQGPPSNPGTAPNRLEPVTANENGSAMPLALAAAEQVPVVTVPPKEPSVAMVADSTVGGGVVAKADAALDMPLPVIKIIEPAPVDRTAMIIGAVTTLGDDDRQSIAVAAFESLDNEHKAAVLAAIGATWAANTNAPDNAGVRGDDSDDAPDSKDQLTANDAESKPGLAKTRVPKEVVEALRQRVEAALKSKAFPVVQMIKAKVFSDDGQVSRFRRGKGIAPATAAKLAAFLDEHVTEMSA
jgi:hypothetical protein